LSALQFAKATLGTDRLEERCGLVKQSLSTTKVAPRHLDPGLSDQDISRAPGIPHLPKEWERLSEQRSHPIRGLVRS
jgi:hypothetical protein